MGEGVERKLAKADRALVGAGPGGQSFAPVVRQHFPYGVGQQPGPVAGAAAAEEVEREENGAGLHGAASHGEGRYNTIRVWERRSVFRTEATMQAIQDYYIAPRAVVRGDVVLSP